MDSKLEAIKKFLEEIPQFLSDLEPGNEYLNVDGVQGLNWKMLNNYSVSETESGDGFFVSGRLSIPLSDVITFPGWHIFKSQHPDVFDTRLYEMYLKENPNMVSDFNLEDFCENFVDHYCEFLNESGIDENDLVLDWNAIRLKSLLSPESIAMTTVEDDEETETEDAETEDTEVETED